MPAPRSTPTVEDWAAAYVASTALCAKIDPPAPPRDWASRRAPVRIAGPGRGPEFDLIQKTRRSMSGTQLAQPRRRAQLIHTFLHHELQAAELMCWAILAFPDTPSAFRRGLLGICLDEIRHMQMYRDHLATLGATPGAFPVRDWFWQRVGVCTTPLEFVALMGIGFEGGNLDHMRRFEELFEKAGDREGAAMLRRVGDEEVPHVRFALKWFRTWTEGLDFEIWRQSLVAPLTPTMMQGKPLDSDRRIDAGFTPDFLDALLGWGRSG